MPWDQVMHKWKTGKLRSGSPEGPKVKSQKQAVAIMLSEKRAAAQGKKEYQAHQDGGPVLPQLKKGETGPQSPTVPGLRKGETGPQSPGDYPHDVKPMPHPTVPGSFGKEAYVAKGGPVKKFSKGGTVEPSAECAFKANIVETLANPTSRRVGLAKGGPVERKEPEGHGWRRWGQGARHPHG